MHLCLGSLFFCKPFASAGFISSISLHILESQNKDAQRYLNTSSIKMYDVTTKKCHLSHLTKQQHLVTAHIHRAQTQKMHRLLSGFALTGSPYCNVLFGGLAFYPPTVIRLSAPDIFYPEVQSHGFCKLLMLLRESVPFPFS